MFYLKDTKKINPFKWGADFYFSRIKIKILILCLKVSKESANVRYFAFFPMRGESPVSDTASTASGPLMSYSPDIFNLSTIFTIQENFLLNVRYIQYNPRGNQCNLCATFTKCNQNDL
jgi:hypothetical protein